jgi:adenine-specific DNA-methyltransferase
MDKQKLELNWVGKNNLEYDISKIEPRILEEDKKLSYGNSNNKNLIIHGDNLLALKALLPEYQGKVKCIYIDPPYNTGNAFEKYDDNVEHSLWLSLLKPRLELMHHLLDQNNGTLWINLDDNEVHYCKVMCDEIFGRNNFVSNVIWHKKNVVQNDAKFFSTNHDQILVYSINKNNLKFNLLPRTIEMDDRYENPDNDPRGLWTSVALQAKSGSESTKFKILFPNGVEWEPKIGTFSRLSKESLLKAFNEKKLWFGKDGKNVPRLKKYLNEVKQGVVSNTIFKVDDVGSTQEAKSETKKLFLDDPFDTPKPERLIHRILALSTNEGDLVLDSFLGSGTTASVAHKMNRNYIGIEMGNHIYSHVKKRLDLVINGKDEGGITKLVNWHGGGGYKFFELSPSFITKDELNNEIIDSYYNGEKLIKAVCKISGYTYSLNKDEYWNHGYSQKSSYIFVTTQIITTQTVKNILEKLDKNDSLVIFAKKFEKECQSVDKKIVIKKIPSSILSACHYGKKEYLLPISKNLNDEDDDE